MTKKISSLFLALFVTATSYGYAPDNSTVVPLVRRTDWTPGVRVGVPGGIPTNRTNLIDVTKPPYNADKTGHTDTTGAINAAIVAAHWGDVVYLPAGVYLTGGLTVEWQRDGITIRGDGIDKTVLNVYGPSGIFGRSLGYNSPPSIPVTSGVAKDSSVITVADASFFPVNSYVVIKTKNDYTVPVISVEGFEFLRAQNVIVTAVSGNTLTISPPLMANFDPSGTYISPQANDLLQFVGIEDMTIDAFNYQGGGGGYGIQFESAYGCWVKNVRTLGVKNYGINFASSINCEIRHCILDQSSRSGGTNGAGLLMNSDYGFLVEDNIIYKTFPLIEVNFSSMGNVIAYNFMTGSNVDTNHAPHNSYNLYEGNIADNFESDGYFGGESEATFYRNWVKATTPDDSGHLSATYSLAFKRFSRNFTVVGNQIGTSGIAAGGYSLGQPNIGNSSDDGTTAQPSAGVYWKDWSLITGLGINGTVTSQNSNGSGTVTITQGGDRLQQYCQVFGGVCLALGVQWNGGSTIIGNIPYANHVLAFSAGLPAQGTAVGIWPRSEGFQELDLDVDTTMIRKSNWFASGNGGSIPGTEGSAGVLPDSLYLPSKPAWFGSTAWPPFSPYNPVQNFEAIPAGYRYVHEPRVANPTVLSASSGSDSASAVFLPFKNVFNPTKETLTIKLSLSVPGTSLTVYDRNGGKVRRLDTSTPNAIWDGKNQSGGIVASGVYLVVLNSNGLISKKKIVVVK